MLSEKIDAMKDELVAAIQDVVRIPSVGGEPAEGAPYGEGPRKCLDWTLAFAEKMGFRTKNVDNVAGWAEMGEGDEMVAVLGHLDVVPEGKGWTVD
ncbi:MAG TPA: peptidase M20, partial [Aminivibrio sp.]|nr:peptidase M20 [Aminivibrio sp.]